MSALMEYVHLYFCKKKENAPKIIRRISSIAAILLYLCGVGYFFGFAWPSFVSYTYISENALSPGVVDEKFDFGHFMNEKLDSLKNHLKSRGEKRDAPYEWLYNEFQNARLEAYVQNFTVQYPANISPSVSGSNVFGVVRAPRGSSTEAVVIAVPYGLRKLPSIAVILGLAKFCRQQIYWAKDLFFVVAEHGEIGMQAWLNAYHGKNSEFIKADQMSCHSGPIQAAICLELNDAKGAEETEIIYNMINGQLPNLDLFNVAVRLSEKHHFWPTIFGRREPTGDPWDKYWELLSIAGKGIMRQGIGPTPGLHSIFGSYNIEAVTLRPKMDKSAYGSTMVSVARILEGMLRSINNLLERFHQSFFFYLLLSPHRYVSIGVYMPAIGLLLLAPLIKACALWVSMDRDSCNGNAKISSDQEGHERKASMDDNAGSTIGADSGDSVKDERVDGGSGAEECTNGKTKVEKGLHALIAIAPYFLASYCIGLLIRFLPDYAPMMASLAGISEIPEHNLLVSVTIVAISAIVPISAKRITQAGDDQRAYIIDLFRCLFLLELGIALGVISVLNFGLGFVLCLIWAPVFSLMTPSQYWIPHLMKFAVAILMNPFVLLFLAHVAQMQSKQAFDTEQLLNAASATKKRIISMIVNTYLHGDWLFTIITVVLYPLWVQLLILLRLRH